MFSTCSLKRNIKFGNFTVVFKNHQSVSILMTKQSFEFRSQNLQSVHLSIQCISHIFYNLKNILRMDISHHILSNIHGAGLAANRVAANGRFLYVSVTINMRRVPNNGRVESLKRILVILLNAHVCSIMR